MSVQIKDEFRDPALKEAVRRCWSCDCASEHLRKRVAAMLEEQTADPGANQGMRFRSAWIIWPLAAAAAMVISVSLFERFRSSPPPVVLASVLPVGLESELIRTHDHCCKLDNHQHLGGIAKTDDIAIADALREKLKQPVLVYHPTDPNWQFRGASVCHVGTSSTGHLVFVKGDEALSIFSLPKNLFPQAGEGSEYSASLDGHSIVVFVKDGALFGIVGTGTTNPISVDDLRQMSQQMKPAVADGPSVTPTGVVLTELLRPVR